MSKYAFKVVGKVYLSEKESSELIRLSRGKVLAMDFGPGMLRLQVDESPWAIPLLIEMRGLTPDGKNGILIWGASE